MELIDPSKGLYGTPHALVVALIEAVPSQPPFYLRLLLLELVDILAPNTVLSGTIVEANAVFLWLVTSGSMAVSKQNQHCKCQMHKGDFKSHFTRCNCLYTQSITSSRLPKVCLMMLPTTECMLSAFTFTCRHVHFHGFFQSICSTLVHGLCF